MSTGMDPLEAALLFAVLAAPLFWLVQRQLDRQADPAWLREQGIVIVRDSAIQGHSAPIGEYMGREVWASVTFMGMVYQFDHVATSASKERLQPGELYLEPGLVYVVS